MHATRILPILLTTVLAVAAPVHIAHAAWGGPAGNLIAPAVHGQPTAMLPDGAGGAFVAFQGQPVLGGGAVRLARVLADGTVPLGWPTDGALACSLASPSQLGAIRMVTDGAGGAFLVWTEGSVLSGSGAPFVQHVLADGSRAPGWPARGRALVAGLIGGLQAEPDGSGGVIVAWGLNGSISSLRVRGNGTNAAGYPVTGRVLMSPLGPGGSALSTFSFARTDDGGFWLGAAVLSADTLAVPSTYRLLRLDSNGGIDLNWLGNGSGIEVPLASSALVNAGACVHGDGGTGAILLAQVGSNAMLTHVLSDQSQDPAWPAAWLDMGPADGIAGISSAIEPDGSGGWYVQWTRGSAIANSVLGHVLGTGTIAPAWSPGLLLQPGYEVKLVATPSGPFLAGTIVLNCSQQNCLAIAEVAHRTAQGGLPPGWLVPGGGVPELGAFPLPDSAFGGIVGMVPDGSGGVLVSWTRPEPLNSAYGTLGSLRVMRFTDPGPLADTPPPAEDIRLTLSRARAIHEGIRVELSGPADPHARLEVFDVLSRRTLGTEVTLAGRRSEMLVPGSSALRPGLYLLRLSSRGNTARGKVVVTR